MELSHRTLCQIWFVLLGVLLAGYAILDGFDLGVGILHLGRPRRPRAPRPDELDRPAVGRQRGLAGDLRRGAVRRVSRTPTRRSSPASTSRSWLLLFALIFRAVSMEFRSKTRVAGLAASLGRRLLRRQHAGRRSSSAWPSATHDRHARSARTWSSPARFFDLLRPYPLLVGAVRRRHVRHARGDLPVPQDRRASCRSGSTAGCGARSASSWCSTC